MRCLLSLVFVLAAVSHTAYADDTSRAATPLGKGVELYSWRDPANDAWRFSLLPGTNRNKAVAEIKAPERTIASVEALERQLAHLAVGEYVSWFNPDRRQFSYPPKAIRSDVTRKAETLQLQLHVWEP